MNKENVLWMLCAFFGCVFISGTVQGGLLDKIKETGSKISSEVNKAANDVTGSPTPAATQKGATSSEPENTPLSPDKAAKPIADIPTLTEAQNIIDLAAKRYQWKMSPSLTKAWSEEVLIGEVSVDSTELGDAQIQAIVNELHIPPSEKLLKFTDKWHKFALTDEAFYIDTAGGRDNRGKKGEVRMSELSPVGILRIPHAAMLSIKTIPKVDREHGLFVSGPILFGGKTALFVNSEQIKLSLFDAILPGLATLNGKYFLLAEQERRIAQYPELNDLSGYKVAKWGESYSNVTALLVPQLGSDFFEFEYIEKFWSDAKWSSCQKGAFKGSENGDWLRFGSPESKLRVDLDDHLSFPFIWNVTGYSVADKQGVSQVHFVDDKFYNVTTYLNKEYTGKGKAILQSMTQKYGQPYWELPNSSKSESRCVWENENGAIIATFVPNWENNPCSFWGDELVYIATNGVTCKYSVQAYSLLEAPAKAKQAVMFKKLHFSVPVEEVMAVNEIPITGRVLLVGLHVEASEKRTARTQHIADNDMVEVATEAETASDVAIQKSTSELKSLEIQYTVMAKRFPDKPATVELKGRVEKAKEELAKLTLAKEANNKPTTENKQLAKTPLDAAKDELLSKLSIRDEKNSEHKLAGTFVCDDPKVNVMAFCQVPPDGSKYLLMTPDNKRVVVEPIKSSWHFIGAIDVDAVEDNLKLFSIGYYSKSVRKYVENKIGSLKVEGKNREGEQKKQESEAVKGF